MITAFLKFTTRPCRRSAARRRDLQQHVERRRAPSTSSNSTRCRLAPHRLVSCPPPSQCSRRCADQPRHSVLPYPTCRAGSWRFRRRTGTRPRAGVGCPRRSGQGTGTAQRPVRILQATRKGTTALNAHGFPLITCAGAPPSSPARLRLRAATHRHASARRRDILRMTSCLSGCFRAPSAAPRPPSSRSSRVSAILQLGGRCSRTCAARLRRLRVWSICSLIFWTRQHLAPRCSCASTALRCSRRWPAPAPAAPADLAGGVFSFSARARSQAATRRFRSSARGRW